MLFSYLGFLSEILAKHRTAGERGDISVTPDYQLHPFRHLDISRAITAES